MKLRLALFALCGMSWFGAAAADEVFQVDTSSRLSYPLRAPADHFAVAVNFDPARYSLTSVSMLPTSNGPGGVPLTPNDDVAVSLAPDSGAGHAILELKPRATSLRFPGEYRIALNLIGRASDSGGRPISSNVTLSITRPEPEFDVDALGGRSTTLYRMFPWSPAAGSVQYALPTPKLADAAEVSVGASELEWIKTRELVPDAFIGVAPAAVSLTPGAPQSLVVTFSSLPYAGDFATTLTFDSDSFVKRRSVGIAVHVKDLPWMPLATILLGVMGGALVTWLSGTRRSTLRSRYRLTQLRLRLAKLAPAIITPVSADRYREITAKLDELERGSRVERIANQELTAVTNQLVELEKSLAATQTEVIGRLAALDAEIAALNAALVGDVPDIVERTQPVSARVAAIRAMDRGGQYEYAAQEAGAAEKRLQVVSRDARATAVEDLSLKISARLPSGADKNLNAKINDLRRLVIGASLEDFMAALNDLHSDLQHVGFAPPMRAAVARPGKAADVPDYALEVKTAPRSLITGQRIDMDIVVANGKPVPDRVVWNFGNGILDVVNGALQASPVYDWPGPYVVSVQLYREADPDFHQNAVASLSIKPGSAARQLAGVVGALIRNEAAVMSISLSLAAVTGLLQLYVDKSFGAPEDYLIALLWGFGIEKSVRGFNAVYSTLGRDG